MKKYLPVASFSNTFWLLILVPMEEQAIRIAQGQQHICSWAGEVKIYNVDLVILEHPGYKTMDPFH